MTPTLPFPDPKTLPADTEAQPWREKVWGLGVTLQRKAADPQTSRIDVARALEQQAQLLRSWKQ